MNPFLAILQVTALLLIGSALRFLLPYAIQGFELVGKENTWGAWPDWEWKYLTGMILSLIGYGVTLLMALEMIAELSKMEPIQLIVWAYTGQDVLRRFVKPFQKKP